MIKSYLRGIDTVLSVVKHWVLFGSLSLSFTVGAHPEINHQAHQSDCHKACVTYLGNEALSIRIGGHHVLFDPFFSETFNIYQSVPEVIVSDIMKGHRGYEDVSVVFISHAHADHFDSQRVAHYLSAHPDVTLVASSQAVAMLREVSHFDSASPQIVEISMTFNQPPEQFEVKGLAVDVVRIPHAGWPQRADVENFIFRVKPAGTGTENSIAGQSIMHMGDADTAAKHYLPHRDYFARRPTHYAFPPYWFFYSMEGRDVLSELLNTEHQIGIHVPVEAPAFLSAEGWHYFHQPGESRSFK